MNKPAQRSSQKFDFAVKELLSGKKISGKDGALAPLVKLSTAQSLVATF